MPRHGQEGTLVLLEEYLLVNAAVGIGIAADAMIATVSRFRHFDTPLRALKWAGAVGLTHWLLPMVGFIGGWYAAVQAGLGALVYGTGFFVMAWFVAVVVRNAAGLLPDQDDLSADVFGSTAVFWGAVWGVSIDALISGPGKTAATASWSHAEVWLSFPFVGFVVFALVAASAWPALVLNRKLQTTRVHGEGLACFFVAGIAVEIVVFGWFGFLALAESLRHLGLSVSTMWVCLADLATACCIGTLFGKRILHRQREVASAAVAGPS